MKAIDFLRGFDEKHFPQQVGPWIAIDAHDPSWTHAELKQMERQNLIQLNFEDTHYRLTLKATKVRG